MNKESIFYDEYELCRICTEKTERGFQFMRVKAGDNCLFEEQEAYTIIFLLAGCIKVIDGEGVSSELSGGEMTMLTRNDIYRCYALTDMECIVLKGHDTLSFCDQKGVTDHIEKWLNGVSLKRVLIIKPRLMEFLLCVSNYLNDGITCPYMHKTKETELSTLFKAYYTFDEMTSFFLMYVRQSHEFEMFVMRNYLKMKGVKEFVDLSGMTLAAFNKKFKSHFKETPYQWLIKQKSKHIYHELSATYKSFTTIAREYHFTDPSHFNRYCKTMFGASPSQIREKGVSKINTE